MVMVIMLILWVNIVNGKKCIKKEVFGYSDLEIKSKFICFGVILYYRVNIYIWDY